MTAPPPSALSAAASDQPFAPQRGHARSLWRVELLGGLRLSDGAQHLTRLPSRAITSLLARLALAPQRAHGREELIELLWPGVALDVGRNRLRQALSTLKGILEPAWRAAGQPVLQADRTQVRVIEGALACDVTEFERAVRTGHGAAARTLYRGELLPGFYDEWIDDERRRLAGLHERLPWLRETASAAATEHAIEAAAAAPPPVARVALPHYLTRMFGAEEQGARLRSLVLAQRLVTLLGPGGAGKSRLAVEVSHSLREARQRAVRDILGGTVRLQDPSTGETFEAAAQDRYYFRVKGADRPTALGGDTDAKPLRDLDLTRLLKIGIEVPDR